MSATKSLATAPKLGGNASNIKWALATLGMILLFNLFFTPHFFEISLKNGHLFGSLIDVIYRSAPIIIMGIGMTLAIATKGIDISVGSVAAISGAVAAELLTQANIPLYLVILGAVGVSVLIGMWNGALIAVIGIQPIIATLTMLVMGRGIAQLITDGQIIGISNPGFEYIGNNGYVLGLPFAVTIAVVIFGLAVLLLRRTAMGMFIESIGINKSASRYAGINVRPIMFFIYVFTAFCASIAGLIYASNLKAADCNSAGLNTELDAILAVVIGGTSMDGGKFSLIGTVVGALVIQALTTTILTLGVPVQVTLIVRAMVVFLLCLLQSANFRRLLANAFKQAGTAMRTTKNTGKSEGSVA